MTALAIGEKGSPGQGSIIETPAFRRIYARVDSGRYLDQHRLTARYSKWSTNHTRPVKLVRSGTRTENSKAPSGPSMRMPFEKHHVFSAVLEMRLAQNETFA